MIRGRPAGRGIDVAQSLTDALQGMVFARVVEVDVDAVDARDGFGVLLLHGGHHHRRVAVPEQKREWPFGGDVVKARQVGDARRIENRQCVEARRLHARPDGLPAARVLLCRDLGKAAHSASDSANPAWPAWYSTMLALRPQLSGRANW